MSRKYQSPWTRLLRWKAALDQAAHALPPRRGYGVVLPGGGSAPRDLAVRDLQDMDVVLVDDDSPAAAGDGTGRAQPGPEA
jgi:hypothetical protein